MRGRTLWGQTLPNAEGGSGMALGGAHFSLIHPVLAEDPAQIGVVVLTQRGPEVSRAGGPKVATPPAPQGSGNSTALPLASSRCSQALLATRA